VNSVSTTISVLVFREPEYFTSVRVKPGVAGGEIRGLVGTVKYLLYTVLL
jgi:hypothetical protein